jgi:hypothetical protein
VHASHELRGEGGPIEIAVPKGRLRSSLPTGMDLNVLDLLASTHRRNQGKDGLGAVA